MIGLALACPDPSIGQNTVFETTSPYHHIRVADRGRLRILHFLATGEMCACELETHFEVDEPVLSLNLRILKRAGILVARNNGADVLYRLRNPKVLNLFRILGALTVEEDEEELRQLKRHERLRLSVRQAGDTARGRYHLRCQRPGPGRRH